MSRKLTDDERSLWERVTSTVRKLSSGMMPAQFPTALAAMSWKTGFNPVLDLHGFTLHDAFSRAKEHIAEARVLGGYRYVTIITGLSGEICNEFPRWMENNPLVRSTKQLRGGGAWEVWLTKNATSTLTR